jgi:hypothetical protein
VYVYRQYDELKSMSQFSLDHLKSGGEIVEKTEHQANKAENVILQETNGVPSVYGSFLSQSDPCPSPTIVESTVQHCMNSW